MTDPFAAKVHGVPGRSLRADGTVRYGRDSARRGQFFEGVTGRALESWLSRRADRASLHLFHDLSSFHAVTGQGYGPLTLGTANIDHVVLSGRMWLLVDAKGVGAGTLATDARGRGVLRRPDGTEHPQSWLDHSKTYSAIGVLVRLTGLRGWAVWVLPDTTQIDESVLRARALRAGGTLCSVSEVRAGELDNLMTGWQPPAAADAVAALRRHVAGPGLDVGGRERIAST